VCGVVKMLLLNNSQYIFSVTLWGSLQGMPPMQLLNMLQTRFQYEWVVSSQKYLQSNCQSTLFKLSKEGGLRQVMAQAAELM
jgi:hypothetical protein